MAQKDGRHWQDERDWAYSEAVYPKLARRYPNRWVAIAHHRVIAAGTNLTKVLAQARRKVHWKEIPLVFVERGIHVYWLYGEAGARHVRRQRPEGEFPAPEVLGAVGRRGGAVGLGLRGIS